MAKILKDRNGNIIAKPKNYCATDEQVQNAIDLAIKDNKINVPTSVNYENLKFITCDKSNELPIMITDSGQFFYYVGETEDTINLNDKKITAGKKTYIDCNEYSDIYICVEYLSVNYNSLKLYWSDKTIKNGNDPNKLYTAIEIPAQAFSGIGLNEKAYYKISVPRNYPYIVFLGEFDSSFNIKITDKKETVVTLNDNLLINAIQNYGKTNNIKNLLNKTALFLGDSYTYAMCSNASGDGSKVTAGEYYTLINNLDMKDGYTYGIVSSTIRTGNNSKGYSYQPMATRVDTMISDHATDDVGLVIFMGGTNDSFGIESSLGTSIWDTDTDHIYGACHHIFNSIKTTWPNTILMVVLQPSCANYTETKNPEGLDISSFSTAQKSILKSQSKQKIVKEVAEFYKLPIVDCCFDWYSPLNSEDLSTYWSSDNLHLTPLGYKKVRKKIENKIKEVLIY
jgi:lysophospholipase L1-like esterase|nr:MAG TPA: hypothetical protein [Caudoviricetes sp.]